MVDIRREAAELAARINVWGRLNQSPRVSMARREARKRHPGYPTVLLDVARDIQITADECYSRQDVGAGRYYQALALAFGAVATDSSDYLSSAKFWAERAGVPNV